MLFLYISLSFNIPGDSKLIVVVPFSVLFRYICIEYPPVNYCVKINTYVVSIPKQLFIIFVDKRGV